MIDGFDIAHPFDARQVARELSLPLLATHPTGILIGNTRTLWPKFCAARQDVADPLEHYIESVIPMPALYAHRTYDGAFLPFQRIAVAAGLGALSPTQLVIHPTYGPWFALRAVVLVECTPPATRRVDPPCRCDAPCLTAFDAAVRSGDPRDWLAVRDACPIGRTWRYDEDQIRYHYSRMLAVGL